MKNSKKIILVIEDELLLLQAISKKLKINNFEVISYTMGRQAIDYLKNIEILPDVIWLDYYLTDMNGLEFMKVIKDNKKWKDIPVMVVSNSASEEKINSLLDLGANKYILKAEERLDDIIKDMKELILERK